MAKILDELDKIVKDDEDREERLPKHSHHKEVEREEPEELDRDEEEDMEEPEVNPMDIGQKGKSPDMEELIRHIKSAEEAADFCAEFIHSPASTETFMAEISLRKSVDALKKLADVVYKDFKKE